MATITEAEGTELELVGVDGDMLVEGNKLAVGPKKMLVSLT